MNRTLKTEDRVLGALREARPPKGMEARLLARLEAAGVEPRGAEIGLKLGSEIGLEIGSLRRTGLLQERPLRWFAVAATIVVVLAAGWYVANAGHEARHVTANDAGTPALPRPSEARETRAAGNEVAGVRRADRSGSVRGTAGGAPARGALSALPSSSAERLADAGAAQLAETEGALVSHPPPPLPVTAQERLLLRYARRSPAEDLLQVSNERRDAQQAREASEFQAFFQPPPPMNGESE